MVKCDTVLVFPFKERSQDTVTKDLLYDDLLRDWKRDSNSIASDGHEFNATYLSLTLLS